MVKTSHGDRFGVRRGTILCILKNMLLKIHYMKQKQLF